MLAGCWNLDFSSKIKYFTESETFSEKEIYTSIVAAPEQICANVGEDLQMNLLMNFSSHFDMCRH